MQKRFWYIDNDGVTQGPFTKTQIKEKIKMHLISPATLMCDMKIGEEFYQAIQIGDIKSFFSVQKSKEIIEGDSIDLGEVFKKYRVFILLGFLVFLFAASPNLKDKVDEYTSNFSNSVEERIDFSEPKNVEKLKKAEKILKAAVSYSKKSPKSKGASINDLVKLYDQVSDLNKKYQYAKDIGESLDLKSFTTIEEITIGTVKKIDNVVDGVGQKVIDAFFLEELIDYYSYSLENGNLKSDFLKRAKKRLRELKKRKEQIEDKNKRNEPGSKRMPETFEELVERYIDGERCKIIDSASRGGHDLSGKRIYLKTLPNYFFNKNWIKLKNIKDKNGKYINGKLEFDKYIVIRLDHIYKIQQEECSPRATQSLLLGGYNVISSWENLDKRFKKMNRGADIEKRTLDFYESRNCNLSEEIKKLIPSGNRGRRG